MVFDGALAASGDENHFGDTGGGGFFNGVLDQRLIHHRQHFFRARFGGGKKARAKTGDGENGFGDFDIFFHR